MLFRVRQGNKRKNNRESDGITVCRRQERVDDTQKDRRERFAVETARNYRRRAERNIVYTHLPYSHVTIPRDTPQALVHLIEKFSLID